MFVYKYTIAEMEQRTKMTTEVAAAISYFELPNCFRKYTPSIDGKLGPIKYGVVKDEMLLIKTKVAAMSTSL